MIGSDLASLLAAQALFLLGGAGLLHALKPERTWADLVQALGLAYLLGVGSVCIIATVALVAGFGLGTGFVIGVPMTLLAAGLARGQARGHRLPRALGLRVPEFGLARTSAWALGPVPTTATSRTGDT